MKHTISLAEAQNILALHVAKKFDIDLNEYKILYQTTIELDRCSFSRQVDPNSSYIEFMIVKK